MASSSDYNSRNVQSEISSLYDQVQNYANKTSNTPTVVRWLRGSDKEKAALETKLTGIIKSLHKMSAEEISPVIEMSARGGSDLDNLLFAIATINPALAEQVQPLVDRRSILEGLKHAPGDTTAQIRKKMDTLQLMTTGNDTVEGKYLLELKRNYIEQYATGDVSNLAAGMERCPELVDWIWDEIKDLPDTEIGKIEEIVHYSAKHGGMIELLQRLDPSKHHSRDEIKQGEIGLVNLHDDLPHDTPIPLPKNGPNGPIHNELPTDFRRGYLSVNFEKFGFQGTSQPEIEKKMEKIQQAADDPRFADMSHVFHQGINMGGLAKVHEYYMDSHVENIGQQKEFRTYIFLFKNNEGETVYRYINVLGACVKPENQKLERMPFDTFYLHIVDCKAGKEDSEATVKRFLSPPLESLNDVKAMMMSLLTNKT
jgi:hypothetical protein